jgi:hypothetical protein
MVGPGCRQGATSVRRACDERATSVRHGATSVPPYAVRIRPGSRIARAPPGCRYAVGPGCRGCDQPASRIRPDAAMVPQGAAGVFHLGWEPRRRQMRPGCPQLPPHLPPGATRCPGRARPRLPEERAIGMPGVRFSAAGVRFTTAANSPRAEPRGCRLDALRVPPGCRQGTARAVPPSGSIESGGPRYGDRSGRWLISRAGAYTVRGGRI